MNKFFGVGRVANEPETKQTQQGVAVTTFSLAITRKANREETDFLRVVTWRALADLVAKYVVKGQRVAVSGEVRTRTYEDSSGQKRYATDIQADEVEFLDKPQGKSENKPQYAEMEEIFEEDSELPF